MEGGVTRLTTIGPICISRLHDESKEQRERGESKDYVERDRENKRERERERVLVGGVSCSEPAYQ